MLIKTKLHWTHCISNEKGALTLTVNWGLEKIKNKKSIQGVKWQALTNFHTSWREEKSNSRWRCAIWRDHQCYEVLTEARRQSGRNYHKYRMSLHTNWGQKGEDLYWWIMKMKLNHILAEQRYICVSESLFRCQDKLTYQLPLKIILVKFGLLLSFEWIYLLSEDTKRALSYLY